jgi:hypothetical protein
MSSSDSYSVEILENFFVYANMYVLPVFYIMGNIGNLLSALVFFKKTWRKNVCVFYFNICLFFESCYLNTGTLCSILNSGFNINLQNSNVILCKLEYYTAYVFSALLPNVLILASIDRLLISSQNVDTRLYSSKRLAYFSVSISTFIWFVFYFHVLIKVNIYQIYPSVFLCYYDSLGYYIEFNYYSNAIIDILFSVVLIILSILAFKNVRRIRSVPRQQRQRVRTMNKKDFQLLRCLYIYDIIYISFVSFPSIYGVYTTITRNDVRLPLDQAIVDFLTDFGIFIHHIPFGISFLIFISVSKAFRQEIKRMVYKMFGKNLMPVQEEENKQQNDARDAVELNVVVNVVSTIVSPA